MIGVFDHPWLGGLFGDQEAAVIWSPDRQITHMLAFEAAFTRALGAVGTIPPTTADDLAMQIAAFQPDMESLRIGTARDGVVVPDLVRQLRDTLGAEPKAIHSGATSQDVIDTALALTLKEFNSLLDRRLGTLCDALDGLAAQFGEATIMGRTRMQAALPISAKDRLLTWSLPLDHHRARLLSTRTAVERLQLGGATGDRAALGQHAELMAAKIAAGLGLGNPPKAWHVMREGVVEYAGLLSLVSGALGKMGQDICLMAQKGIEDITMKSGGGSSAMPHKQNPVLAELLVTLSRFNATQVSAMHHALIHEQERSGAAWALEWMVLPQIAQATARGVAVATDMCHEISRIGTVLHSKQY
jgi:3-carboxy-cis,cis-muconate cycloisomerase